MIKKILSFLMMMLFSQWTLAQSVNDYYGSAKGTSGKNLKTALYQIVKDHKQCSYADLWENFKQTDCRSDGRVWDMYSNMTSYEFGSLQQGANYTREGDSYNREHSFPKSWFGDVEDSPMYTDLFHLYPTDGLINSKRGNDPFGETDATDGSANGWSKWGKSSLPGFNGRVFEPNDEYKGDFARTYFYMATRYENVIADWTTKKGAVYPMLNCTSYPVFSDWALEMLLRWAAQDPVSQKEIDRNNAVYGIQHNRNPYIDYPGLEQYVWGSKTSTAFDPYNYQPEVVDPSPEDEEVASPVFSVVEGKVNRGTEVVISCATGGTNIFYAFNGGSWTNHLAPATITVEEDVEVSAYAMLGDKSSDTVRVKYQVIESSVVGGDAYVKVMNESDLVVGAQYLIVCESAGIAMAESSGKDYRNGADVSIVEQTVHTKVSAAGLPYVLTLGGTSEGYTFFDAASKTYLAVKSDKNKLNDLEKLEGDVTCWTVTFSEENMLILNKQYSGRRINYNVGTPRFAAYKENSGQTAVALYKAAVSSGIDYTAVENGTVDIYTLDGRLVREDVSKACATVGLSRGLYVIGGVKVFVR